VAHWLYPFENKAEFLLFTATPKWTQKSNSREKAGWLSKAYSFFLRSLETAIALRTNNFLIINNKLNEIETKISQLLLLFNILPLARCLTHLSHFSVTVARFPKTGSHPRKVGQVLSFLCQPLRLFLGPIIVIQSFVNSSIYLSSGAGSNWAISARNWLSSRRRRRSSRQSSPLMVQVKAASSRIQVTQ